MVKIMVVSNTRRYVPIVKKKNHAGDIVKGYEYEPDQYVVFQPEELAALKLKSTKAIDIEAFVDMDEVSAS